MKTINFDVFLVYTFNLNENNKKRKLKNLKNFRK